MMRRQTGATLIELMIGLVLGTLLIAGISNLFLQMQKVSRIQRAVNDITDNGRYVLELLQKEIRRTGGLRNKLAANGGAATVFTQNPAVQMPGTTLNLALANSEYIKGVTSNVAPNNDALVIRYQLIDSDDLSPNDPSNSSSPCTVNTLLDPDDDPTNDRHVVSVYFFVRGNSLQCTSTRAVNDVCVANCALSDAPATVVDNVQSMTVRYGIDSDSPSDRIVNYYADAGALAAGNQALWQSITSIRATLVLRSSSDNLAMQVTPYSVEDKAVTPADKRLYRVFSTTIALRNQL